MDVCPEELADGIMWPATIVHENAYHRCQGGASGKYGLSEPFAAVQPLIILEAVLPLLVRVGIWTSFVLRSLYRSLREGG